MIEELMQEADSAVRNLTTIRDGGAQISEDPTSTAARQQSE
jgi:hypothetical protein